MSRQPRAGRDEHLHPAHLRKHHVEDDAASGLGLLNFFRRGLYCVALTEQELTAAGLTRDML